MNKLLAAAAFTVIAVFILAGCETPDVQVAKIEATKAAEVGEFYARIASADSAAEQARADANARAAEAASQAQQAQSRAQEAQANSLIEQARAQADSLIAQAKALETQAKLEFAALVFLGLLMAFMFIVFIIVIMRAAFSKPRVIYVQNQLPPGWRPDIRQIPYEQRRAMHPGQTFQGRRYKLPPQNNVVDAEYYEENRQ